MDNETQVGRPDFTLTTTETVISIQTEIDEHDEQLQQLRVAVESLRHDLGTARDEIAQLRGGQH